ncbi:TetR/AcrR family transcriptional regulator [Desulfitobacterium sp. AusDCA]|uniref:TetR/AcrR family transcriptional regulator n=1 Tax=Desulfitobacterium sp. AusDCA TaxID=3240383 RepID=UPI003DA6E64C
MENKNSTLENKDSRRRGVELEDALLDAAEQELNAVGYNAFTIKGVAERARTSRSVLNRRWSSRVELVLAVLSRHGLIRTEPPNTGHLRTDVLALMNSFLARVSEIGKNVILGMLSDTANGYESSFDLQKHIHESNSKTMSIIIERAVARGEARPDISSIVITLPIDLLRAEMLISHDVITQNFLEKVVDEIFLPLVRNG